MKGSDVNLKQPRSSDPNVQAAIEAAEKFKAEHPNVPTVDVDASDELISRKDAESKTSQPAKLNSPRFFFKKWPLGGWELCYGIEGDNRYTCAVMWFSPAELPMHFRDDIREALEYRLNKATAEIGVLLDNDLTERERLLQLVANLRADNKRLQLNVSTLERDSSRLETIKGIIADLNILTVHKARLQNVLLQIKNQVMEENE